MEKRSKIGDKAEKGNEDGKIGRMKKERERRKK